MKKKIELLIILLVSVLVLGCIIGAFFLRLSRGNAAEEKVAAADAVTPTPEPAPQTDETDKTEEAEPYDDEPSEEYDEEDKSPLPKYDDLLKVNPYVAGWLKIDDSVIDVPVVYTPGSQNYFLHRDIEGNDASSGTLFIAVDWEDGYNNTLIYGHNMKDGSGFGSLSKFENESYGKSHPVIRFSTLYEEKDYELYAVFYSQIEEEELETEEDRAEADALIEEGKIDLGEDFGDEDIYRQEKDEDNGRFRY